MVDMEHGGHGTWWTWNMVDMAWGDMAWGVAWIVASWTTGSTSASASSSPRRVNPTVHPMVRHMGLGAHLGLVLDREALRLCDEGKLVACGQGGWGDMVRDGGVSTPAAKAEAVVVETVATTQAAVKRSGGRG
jgi:hypothetical protein